MKGNSKIVAGKVRRTNMPVNVQNVDGLAVNRKWRRAVAKARKASKA